MFKDGYKVPDEVAELWKLRPAFDLVPAAEQNPRMDEFQKKPYTSPVLVAAREHGIGAVLPPLQGHNRKAVMTGLKEMIGMTVVGINNANNYLIKIQTTLRDYLVAHGGTFEIRSIDPAAMKCQVRPLLRYTSYM